MHKTFKDMKLEIEAIKKQKDKWSQFWERKF